MTNKSKMPDLSEITHMAGKLFSDIKNSVTEIVDDYKTKRASEESKPEVKEPKAEVKKPTVEVKEPKVEVKESKAEVKEPSTSNPSKTESKSEEGKKED